MLRTLAAAALGAALACGHAAAAGHDPLFDGGGRQAPALSLPAPFERAPTLSFNGLELKTFLFSDGERISEAIGAALGRSRVSVRAALYELNLPGLARDLIAAKERGLDVAVVVDHRHMFSDGLSEERSRELDELVAAGVPLRVLRGGGQRGIMHNKFVLLDGRLLETGSFNWSKAADTVHREDALFRDDPALIAGFAAYWGWLWDQARPLEAGEGFEEPRGAPPREASPSLVFKGRPWPAYAFSPRGGVEERLVEAVSLCRRRVDIAMFAFTSKPIAQALLEAKNRGAAVRVLMDRSQASGEASVARWLAENGVDLKLVSGLTPGGVLHHKFALFDGELLETGSYNYSFNASVNNFENAVFSTRPEDLAGYQAAFERVYALAALPAAEDLRPRPGALAEAGSPF